MTSSTLITSRLRLWADQAATWALVVASAATAALLLARVAGREAPDTSISIPFWVLVIAFTATERCTVQIHLRRNTHTLTLSEIPLVLGLVFASPTTTVMTWLIGTALMLAADRQPAVRMAFNLAVCALTVAVVATAIRVVAGATPDPSLSLWVGAGGGALAASVVSAGLIGLAMRLSGEQMPAHRLREMAVMGLLVSFINGSLALAVAVVVAADPVAGLLLVAPAAALIQAYRAYTAQRRQNQDLEFLYEASRTLSGAQDGAAGMAGVLAKTVDTLHAEVAEVCLLPPDATSSGTRITVGPDERIEVDAAVDADVATALCALVAEGPPQVITPEQATPALRLHFERLGVREAMVAGLRGDRRLVGTMLVANRVGETAFGPRDRRLFSTLAGHTGTTLGHAHLEQRVAEMNVTHAVLHRQAFHDPLTHLANRLLFLDRVTHALSRRTGNVVVVYIDLDDFKEVNDTLGHEAGDLLLMAVADRLRASLRASDTPARLGGDEFAVLLVDIRPDDVNVVVDRILKSFGAAVSVGNGVERTISASVGIAIADSSTMATEDLVRAADSAMYVSKHGGKSRATTYRHGA